MARSVFLLAHVRLHSDSRIFFYHQDNHDSPPMALSIERNQDFELSRIRVARLQLSDFSPGNRHPSTFLFAFFFFFTIINLLGP